VSASKYTRPYLDSSVFIGWLNREFINGKDRREIARSILDRARAGEFQITISAITVAEVVKIPDPSISPLTPEGGEELIRYFELDYFDFVPVDRLIAEEAQRLQRQYQVLKLKPADAMHLACAVRNKCDFLLAWDEPFNKIGTHDGVQIEEPIQLPDIPKQSSIFDTVDSISGD
jgi:predicted nucleic acid-binding protein